MYTFIDVPPGGATNDSFDGERLFIQLEISTIHPIWRYLQLNWRYLQLNWRYLQLNWRYVYFDCRYLQFSE